MSEKYYYGQGKVYLAKRNKDGTPGPFRWVGDVSELNFELSVEEATHKESYSGQRATVRRFNIGKDGSVSVTFHDHSPENFALVLYSHVLTTKAGTVSGELLPASIKAGERFTLKHIQVSDVVITGLKEETDYVVDAPYGAIEFLKAQSSAPSVSYSYAAQINTPMFTKNPEDVYLRYEGINLAENGAPVVTEFYRTQFSPTSGMNLINNDASLGGLSATANVLYDNAQKSHDARLGNYGRIITGG